MHVKGALSDLPPTILRRVDRALLRSIVNVILTSLTLFNRYRQYFYVMETDEDLTFLFCTTFFLHFQYSDQAVVSSSSYPCFRTFTTLFLKIVLSLPHFVYGSYNCTIAMVESWYLHSLMLKYGHILNNILWAHYHPFCIII